MRRSGFTLIELLVVIAIVAVLAVTVILTLNPAELLRQVRDSNRLTDVATLNTAIAGYQAEFPSASLPTSSVVYISLPDSSATCASHGLPALPSGWTYSCKSPSTYRNVDGTGWIPLNLSSAGTRVDVLPVDPTNSSSTRLYYTFAVNGTSYELTTQLESLAKHSASINDGDANPGVYSAGSGKNLTPATRDMGLVRYWPFDDGSGTTARDATGNSTDATLYGPPTWFPAGSCKVGGCLNFPGTTGRYVRSNTVSDLSSMSQYTVSFWFNTSVSSGVKYLFNSSNTNFFLNGSNMVLQANPPLLSSSGTWNASQWNHAVATYDGSNVRIYINGAEAATPSAKSGSAAFPSYLSIGSSLGTDNPAFSGRLDEVRMYSRALSADEIRAIYNAER